MKIVVSAKGDNLEAQVEPRFGRSPYFLLVNSESMEYEVLSNGQNLQAAQGAGIQAAALIARQRPEALLTGNCGPKAYPYLVGWRDSRIPGGGGFGAGGSAGILCGKIDPGPGTQRKRSLVKNSGGGDSAPSLQGSQFRIYPQRGR